MRLRHPARAAVVSLWLGALVAAGASSTRADDLPAAGERRASFDHGWRFQKGELPGAEAPGFADGAWRTLDLPHDWAIEGPFDPKINPHAGALPAFGVAWYRKHFTVPASARGRYYSVEFDGAMSNAKVYLNGHELGGRPYGYIGFSLRPHAAAACSAARTCSPCASRPRSSPRAGTRAPGSTATSGSTRPARCTSRAGARTSPPRA